MAYDIKGFQTKLQEIEDWLRKELSSIRTGRATITLLDSVSVEQYGSRSPLNQVASINIEDPKTIRIVPWDKSILKDIESAIVKADLGVSTSVDAEGVRVKFPDLTTETRERLVKQAKAKIEEAKVSLRNERNRMIKDVEDSKKAGEISEDDMKREVAEVDKDIKEKQATFDEMGKNKEKEILD